MLDINRSEKILLRAILLSVYLQTMHEISVMSDLISAITKKLEEYSVEAVEEVTLVIGDLTNLGEEQMEFAYEIMIKGTKLEGSKLVIEHEKINVRCELCGYNGGVKEIRNDYTCHSVPILSCPKCGGDVIVTAGQSCAVKSIGVVETG